MNWSDCPIVEVVPGKVSGVPILRGTRVPADTVLENFEGGSPVEEIAYNFDLDPEQVKQILAFAHSKQAVSRL